MSAGNAVAGVDGAKGEWVVARYDGSHIRWSVAHDVDEVVRSTEDCSAVGVDMPLSMPEHGYRTSESEAKSFLGPARSSIFHTPVRAVLDADSYEDACAISRSVTGKAISKQTWYLMAGVRSWQSVRFDPERVVEVHPECAFRMMAPSTEFASKKTARGAGQRLAALGSWLDPRDLAAGLAELPVGPVVDDALDAAAAAWSAWRFSRGEHRMFGTTDAADRIVV
ncbi:Predicted nuclease (RNAse H fold) [Rhodococcoides kyotonense]|uniref:Predicted nuclease (RNAse H fold) n=1 Tax=Rhodococcoides kyotonense TaxID=398843 RepID=A0A239HEY9_9NOCA|nr:Predicted nuclease (RNAse H fold) [Rhodococcus kyotonensis]